MAGSRIEGAGLRGVMRLTWVEDHLAHVLNHCETDEPCGAWTGLACQDYGLALGGNVDNATLRRLSAHGQIADLIWEPRAELAAEHGQLLQAAIQAAEDGKPKTAEQLWQQVHAIWSVAWSANYAALKFLQETGLSRFSPIKPQRWVAASFDHHRGPHSFPHPHVHNIVITALTTGPCLRRPSSVADIAADLRRNDGERLVGGLAPTRPRPASTQPRWLQSMVGAAWKSAGARTWPRPTIGRWIPR